MSVVDSLKKRHFEMFSDKRRDHRETVQNIFRDFIKSEGGKTEDRSLLYAKFYLYFTKYIDPEIYPDEKIVGTNWHWLWNWYISEELPPSNGGHFTVDFERILKDGISVIKSELTQDEHAHYVALDAFSAYVKKYADKARVLSMSASGDDKARLDTIFADCERIAENSADTFRQALQLVWFIQTFLELESNSAAISLGRMDAYLYPYYENDIKRGILTREEALELIECFYIKVSEGDESTMLTVGAPESELTELFLEAQTYLNMRQPSISLRVSDKTSDKLLSTAARLTACGSGMPAYVNDRVIKEGISRLGYDESSADGYVIVGCYEATPEGVFSNTVIGWHDLYDSFDEFLKNAPVYATFDEFLEGYKAYFDFYYENVLVPQFKKNALADISRPSPFARALFSKKNREYLFGITMMSIGIIVDSIYTVKALVYDEPYTTVEKLRAAALDDFNDTPLYAKIKSLREYYGSASAITDSLAKEVTAHIGNVVQKYKLAENVISSPALFWFTADITQRDNRSTVNGRRRGELLSYGIMPCGTPHKQTLTSSLNSCANISAELFPNGCPAMITLAKGDIERGLLTPIIKSYFAKGGFHLAVNTGSAELFEEARSHPDEHTDLMVKISGYSTQFISVDKKIQDALIERAKAE